MFNLIKLFVAASMFAGSFLVVTSSASANSALCSALQNGATWSARDNSRNSGKTGSIKLSGSCAIGASGAATVSWDGETSTTTYHVHRRTLFVGGKAYRAHKKAGGGWVVVNTSSPI